MDEKSQGAIEYLLILSAALTVLAGIVYMLYNTSSGLGGNVESRIENVKDTVVGILT